MFLFMPCQSVFRWAKYRSRNETAGFPKFGLLPTEIRLKIWFYVCQESRDVFVRYCKTAPNVIHFESRTPLPALFHVCSESRHVGMKTYKIILPDMLTLLRPIRPKILHPKTFGDRFRELRNFGLWGRAHQDKEEWREAMPNYYNPESDTVFFEPRTYEDEVGFSHLRRLDDEEIDALVTAQWNAQRHVVSLDPHQPKVVYTMKGNTSPYDDFSIILSNGMSRNSPFIQYRQVSTFQPM